MSRGMGSARAIFPISLTNQVNSNALATLLPVNEQRITMPYLPLIAVISAVGLTTIRRPVLRYSLSILMMSLAVFQYWAKSYGIPSVPQELAIRNAWIEIYLFDQHQVRSPRDFQVRPLRWGHAEILDVIQADAAAHGSLRLCESVIS